MIFFFLGNPNNIRKYIIHINELKFQPSLIQYLLSLNNFKDCQQHLSYYHRREYTVLV